MSAEEKLEMTLSFLTLGRTRRRLANWKGVVLVGGISSVFAFVSMLVGQMLVLAPVQGPYFTKVIYGVGATRWWNYPLVLIVQPWGIVSLPFFPTLAMVLVSLGVGIGAAVGVLLLVPLLKRSKGVDARSTSAGAVAGVGPAVTGLATLGACCCTGCVGAAGVTVVAAASGTNLYDLLFNNWYIGFFQIAVVYLSLLVQERTLRLPAEYCPVPPPMDRRFAAGAGLRLGLLIAGITWSLAMFVEWGDNAPLHASSAQWYHWLFEHQLLSLTSIGAGLFPKEFALLLRRIARRAPGMGWRVVLAVAGISWGTWVPGGLVHLGLGGFANEWFGLLGLPASWGAVTPDASLGAALYFHWTFQHLLLAGFALGVAVAPVSATQPLLWTVAGGRTVAVDPVPSRGPPSELPSGPGPVATGSQAPDATARPARTEVPSSGLRTAVSHDRPPVREAGPT